MPTFAPVAPIQVLEGLYAHSLEAFGNYHLLLAHHTVEHKQRFKDLFARAEDDGWEGTIIMDNSIVELGTAVNTDMIVEAVDCVRQPNNLVYPVLPDVMGNGDQTRKAVIDAYPEWAESMSGEGFVAVCQGNSFQDFMDSLTLFGDQDSMPAIKMLSIPRILTKIIGTRTKAALAIRPYMKTHKIHLLGFSDNIPDDIDAAFIVGHCAIDSAVPLRLRETFTEFVQTAARPADWFETAQVDAQMVDNLTRARKIFGEF